MGISFIMKYYPFAFLVILRIFNFCGYQPIRINNLGYAKPFNFKLPVKK